MQKHSDRRKTQHGLGSQCFQAGSADQGVFQGECDERFDFLRGKSWSFRLDFDIRRSELGKHIERQMWHHPAPDYDQQHRRCNHSNPQSQGRFNEPTHTDLPPSPMTPSRLRSSCSLYFAKPNSVPASSATPAVTIVEPDAGPRRSAAHPSSIQPTSTRRRA